MHQGYSKIRGLVRTCPLPLLSIKESTLIEYANSLLPFSTGIEVECSFNREIEPYVDVHGWQSYQNEAMETIPHIMEVNFDTSEKRFRIPSGIKGMICLWHVCEYLDRTCLLNPKSGIHYHTDCTSWWGKHSILDVVIRNKEWMLNSLDSWGYKGTYNGRDVMDSEFSSKWVRMQRGYKTMEVRIGEMSFDYEVLMKRILHCQSIATKLKNDALRAYTLSKRNDRKSKSITRLNAKVHRQFLGKRNRNIREIANIKKVCNTDNITIW